MVQRRVGRKEKMTSASSDTVTRKRNSWSTTGDGVGGAGLWGRKLQHFSSACHPETCRFVHVKKIFRWPKARRVATIKILAAEQREQRGPILSVYVGKLLRPLFHVSLRPKRGRIGSRKYRPCANPSTYPLVT